MFDPHSSPERWLAPLNLPRIGRDRMPFGRAPRDATFDWLDVVRDLAEPPPATPTPEPEGATRAPTPPIVLGPYLLLQSGTRIELRIGLTLRWVVDAALFGGTPQVAMVAGQDSATISLAHAFYPGTTIPADLKAHIFDDNGTWRIRLRLKFGAFDATIPLQPWLDRTLPAVSLVGLGLSCCPLGPASELRADGGGAAAFTPDWLLGVFGPNLFRLDGFTGTVTADIAAIVPVAAGGPTFLVLPQSFRRTALLFFSDTQFPLVPELSQAWPRVHRGAFRFDGLAVEAGLDAADKATRVVFAQSVADPELLAFEPAAGLRGNDGEPFRLLLENPRYAVVFDAARTRVVTGLVAGVVERRQWMHGPGCSLVLTRSDTQPLLILLDIPGQPLAAACRARAPEIAFHVPNMLVRPVPALPRMEVVFTWGALPAAPPGPAGHVEIDPTAGTAVVRLPRDLTLELVRRNDFLVLGYQFDNLRFEGSSERRRFLRDGADAPFLVVRFPPQSVGEEAFFETAAGYSPGDTDAPNAPLPPKIPDAPPVKALLAQPSRLVFQVPDGARPIDLSEPGLLTWTDFAPSLAPTALPGRVILTRPNRPDIVLLEHTLAVNPVVIPGSRRPGSRLLQAANRRASLNVRPFDRIRLPFDLPLVPSEPGWTTTAIEAPFRLIISPNRYCAWAHAISAPGGKGRYELWHTRLGIRSGAAVDEERTLHRTVRAIWARDFTLPLPVADDNPFLMSLSQGDRRILVRLTSDYTISPPPVPVGVNRLMLTALGAWMDTEAKFDPPADLPIEEWLHRATLGRDHFVKVVYRGHLWSLGNRASLVKITERKVQPTSAGDPAAYLRQRLFIVVKEPERTYTGAGYAKGGREFPFKRVRILTKVTPNLDPPAPHILDGPGVPPLPALARFWPYVLGQPFRFHVKAWDWEDREIDFTIPLAFVRTDVTATGNASNQGALDAVVGLYNADEALRFASLGGQGVSYADTDAASLGKTRFETETIVLKALAPSPPRTDGRATPCYPQLESANVSIPALRQMAGSMTTAKITIKPYIDLGFAGGNPAKLFADVQGASLDYTGKADRSGAVVTPSLEIRGLARELGAVGDAGPNMQNGTFSPTDFFAGASPKLLGGISLVDVIASATGAEFLAKTPKLVTENRDDFIRTRVDWKTDKLKKSANGFVPSLSDGGPPAALSLSSALLTRKDSGATDFTLSGQLTNFRLSLFDVIEVAFRVFSFTSENGKKPDFHVELDGQGFKFTGNLEFVNALVAVLDVASFTDPPFLDVKPDGLALGYTATVPSVALGVVSISNIALGARLALPFTGDPARLRFNLSERQNPFIVSVAPFGGGGFFAIAVGVDGLEVLEASLEFGGNLSIDLGVASGGVYVMAGIYFRIRTSTPESSELTGYVRLGGHLSVLGIISLSIEFYLGLSYGDGKAWGEARVTVTVKVLLFSADVTVSCRREFAGSSGDPPFRELMPFARWQAYAGAFA